MCLGAASHAGSRLAPISQFPSLPKPFRIAFSERIKTGSGPIGTDTQNVTGRFYG